MQEIIQLIGLTWLNQANARGHLTNMQIRLLFHYGLTYYNYAFDWTKGRCAVREGGGGAEVGQIYIFSPEKA